MAKDAEEGRDVFLQGVVGFIDSVGKFVKSAAPVIYDGSKIVKDLVSKTKTNLENVNK